MTDPIVSCRNVTKTFGEGELMVRALDAVNLDILAGDFATLAGPSGSGKTTLLNMIGALDHPSSGQVLIEGEDITGLGQDALSELRLRKIGFVFQAYNLIPVLSARENIEFVLELQGVGRELRRARAEELLEKVGLAGLGHRRPSALSGGQQQRVAVARALVSNPAIVLADEPTANLDSRTTAELVDLMQGLNREFGTTFVIGTHDPRVIDRSRRHIELEDGRITSDTRL